MDTRHASHAPSKSGRIVNRAVHCGARRNGRRTMCSTIVGAPSAPEALPETPRAARNAQRRPVGSGVNVRALESVTYAHHFGPPTRRPLARDAPSGCVPLPRGIPERNRGFLGTCNAVKVFVSNIPGGYSVTPRDAFWVNDTRCMRRCAILSGATSVSDPPDPTQLARIAHSGRLDR